jgi:3-phosphoshikimate 1-carboxyvinyltransferase
LSKGITLTLEGEVTSASYVQMTLDLLAQLGASVQTSSDLRVMRVSPAEGAGADGTRAEGAGRATVPSLDGFDLAIEPDASGATYLWAAAALVPGLTCRIKGISPRSLQGDAHFAALLGRMGAVVACSEQDQERANSPWTSVTGAAVHPLPVLVDMSDMPDAAMTLASVACFAKGTSIVRGLRTLRAKETDRIKALQNELSKIGVVVRTPVADDDGAITITPPVGGVDCSPDCAPVEFDTYDDHRMAMSMAVISVRRPNCIIKDPACVAKTYPNFWTHWWQLVQGT